MLSVYVIIVKYNGAQWLDKCLGSLRTSTIPLNPVVVDNASSDNTVNILASSYPEVVQLKCKENFGFGRANNYGIEYALRKGADYIFLLNQDAWIFPDTISKLIEVHKRNPEYMILSPLHLYGSGSRLEYNFSKWLSLYKSSNLSTELASKVKMLEEVYAITFVNAALWLLPKECIKNIGVFDPSFFHYGEDVDFSNRVKYHGYKIGVCLGASGVHDCIPPIRHNKK